MAYQDWDPEQALQRLAEEKSFALSANDGDPVKTAESIVQTAAPEAALSVCWLAIHSLDERLRLNASKYILDRVLPEGRKSGSEDPIGDLYKALSANDT